MNKPETVKVTAKVVSNLSKKQDEKGADIARRALSEQPYWSVERARIGTSQKVSVELIVNGEVAETTEILADGKWKDLAFNYAITRSSWIALRVFPSAHSNPVFVIVNDKPVRECKSAEWSRKAVDQSWKMKQGNIRTDERPPAEKAYDEARKMYDAIIKDCK